jgi:hypothetical protein
MARSARSMAPAPARRAARRAGPWLLWFAVVGGALAWSLHLLTGWYLEELACGPVAAGQPPLGITLTVWIVAITVLFGAVSLAAMLVAWRLWRRTALAVGDGSASMAGGMAGTDPSVLGAGEAVDAGGTEALAARAGRASFMALLGLVANALFLIIVVAGGAALLFLGPCLR